MVAQIDLDMAHWVYTQSKESRTRKFLVGIKFNGVSQDIIVYSETIISASNAVYCDLVRVLKTELVGVVEGSDMPRYRVVVDVAGQEHILHLEGRTIYESIYNVATSYLEVTYVEELEDIDRPDTATLAHEEVKRNVAKLYLDKSSMPVEFEGSLFDADSTARGRITNMVTRLLSGAGLPSVWVGWRDYNNTFQWEADSAEDVLEKLTELLALIEDREQALLISVWEHKAAIEALSDIDEILAYDTLTGWPEENPLPLE